MFIIQPYEDTLEEAIEKLNELKKQHSIEDFDYTDLLKPYREKLAEIEIKQEKGENTLFDLMTAQDLHEEVLEKLYHEQQKY